MSSTINLRRLAVALVGTLALVSVAVSPAMAAKKKFTRKPITIMFLAPLKTNVGNFTDADTTVKRYAAKINKRGGLNGSQVKVITCNDVDATSETKCVRRAKDAKAVAFVGSTLVFNPEATLDSLAKSKLASLSPLLLQFVEHDKRANFPTYSTSLPIIACPEQLRDVGVKSVSAITTDLAVQQQLLETLKALTGKMKIPFGAGVSVPISTTDFSAAVKQIDNAGSDGVVDILSTDKQAAFISAARSLGVSFKGICGANNFGYAAIKQLGSAANVIHMSTGLDLDVNDNKKLPILKDFNKLTKGISFDGPGNALNAYLGVYLLEQASKKIHGQITNAKVWNAMSKLKVNLKGAGMPTLDFSKPGPKGFSRLVNPTTKLYRWDSGKKGFVKTKAKPVNVLKTFAALSAK
jgi:ABC-type branched-subunit amino acid transport system substrate-binding protein